MSWTIRRVERRVSSDRRRGFDRRERDRHSPLMLMPAVHLTTREREIRELIALGLGNKEIARRLNIATNTVKSHVHNMLGKLALLEPAERRFRRLRR